MAEASRCRGYILTAAQTIRDYLVMPMVRQSLTLVLRVVSQQAPMSEL